MIDKSVTVMMMTLTNVLRWYGGNVGGRPNENNNNSMINRLRLMPSTAYQSKRGSSLKAHLRVTTPVIKWITLLHIFQIAQAGVCTDSNLSNPIPILFCRPLQCINKFQPLLFKIICFLQYEIAIFSKPLRKMSGTWLR